MKICTKCKKSKDLEEFNFSNKSKGTRRAECKLCLSKRFKK